MEVTAESEFPICEPVNLACGHYIYLPCLQSWAQSDAENRNTCPFCRAPVSPRNPSENLRDSFAKGIAVFRASSSAAEDVTHLLHMLDSFFSGLPVSIPSLHITLTEEVEILGHWVSNIARLFDGNTIAFEFATNIFESPSIHDEMQAWAALKSLYWSCHRLRSFRACDAENFRLACQAQFRSRVLFETLSFASKLSDALLDLGDEDEDDGIDNGRYDDSPLEDQEYEAVADEEDEDREGQEGEERESMRNQPVH